MKNRMSADNSLLLPNGQRKIIHWWHWVMWCTFAACIFFVSLKFYGQPENHDGFLHLDPKNFSVYDPYLKNKTFLSVAEYDGVVFQFDEMQYGQYIQGALEGNYVIQYYKDDEYLGEFYFETPIDQRGMATVCERAMNEGFNKLVYLPVSGKAFWFSYIAPLDKEANNNLYNYPPISFKAAFFGGENLLTKDATYVNGIYAYFSKEDSGKLIFQIANVSDNLIVNLLYVEDYEGKRIASFDKTALPSAVSKKPSDLRIQTIASGLTANDYDLSDLYICYHYEGKNEIRREKVNPFAPINEAAYQSTEIRTKDNMKDFVQLQIEGEKISFKGDSVILTAPLFIPDGYELHIEGGQSIDLQNNSFIHTRSPIYVNGTEDMPATLTSSDNSVSAGLAVIQAAKRSKIDYLICDNLGEVSSGIYHLTGAVTFYESDVDFFHTEFLNNRSEDGLNAVRSDISLTACRFYNTAQDAFDSDFCTGIFKECRFEITGNDALDVSTSEMQINDCVFININDKAVSCGERSIVQIERMHANNVQVGIGAKDSSVVTANNVTIQGALIGLCSYQKKPEFGPSMMTVSQYSLDKNVDFSYLIEQQDTLYVDGQRWYASGKKKQALIIQRMINEESIK